MPNWYYDKQQLRNTPSVRDGISLATERRYRKEGARFIITCGTQMGLVHNTLATGVVYFHRFYMFHSFKSFPRYVTACCCLFLAGKVEETPKKCRDIIKVARSLLTDNQFYSFGEDPKEEVMTLERILLQTIKFDLQVEHPYNFLLKYAKCMKGDQSKLQKMVQMAWNFVNDSLSTVVCLQWEPEIIAVALIHLASKINKFQVDDWAGRQYHHLRWWDMFVENITMDILEDICHQVLDLYQSNQKEQDAPNSPPQKPPSRADSPVPVRSSAVTTTVTTAATTNVLHEQPTSSSRSMKVSANSNNHMAIATITNAANNAQVHYAAAASTAPLPAIAAYNNEYNNAHADLPATAALATAAATTIAVPATAVSESTHVPLPQHAASSSCSVSASTSAAAIGSNYALYPTPPPATPLVGVGYTPNHYRAPPPPQPQHHHHQQHMHGNYSVAPPPPPLPSSAGSVPLTPFITPNSGWNHHQQPAPQNQYRAPLPGPPLPPAARGGGGFYRHPGNYIRQQQHQHHHQQHQRY